MCASTASALSLLRLFKKPIPDVFRDEVMNPIGASTTWKWVPYTNSYVDIDGKRMASVSGGTRWGGGMWISSYDMARFGLLWLRNGKWGDTQIVSPAYVKTATTASAHGPDYGFLWWLNTSGNSGPARRTIFRSARQGGNIIHIEPAQRSRRRLAMERAIERGIEEGRRRDHEVKGVDRTSVGFERDRSGGSGVCRGRSLDRPVTAGLKTRRYRLIFDLSSSSSPSLCRPAWRDPR